MKKLAVTLSLAALATGAWAQGFVSISDSTANVSTNGAAAGLGTGLTSRTAGAYMYDTLFNASTVTTIDSSLQGLASAGWSDAGFTGVNNSGIGGNGHISNTGGVPTVGNNIWQVNSYQSAIVVGWSSNLGANWAAVQALLNGPGVHFNGAGWTNLPTGGFLGYTTIANGAAGSSSGSAAALFANGTSGQVPTPITAAWNLYTTTTAAVPEPATLALAGLGAAGLLIFRRRK